MTRMAPLLRWRKRGNVSAPSPPTFYYRRGTLRREGILKVHWFVSTQEVQQLSDSWLVTCNEHRPHDALGGVPPPMDPMLVTARSESN